MASYQGTFETIVAEVIAKLRLDTALDTTKVGQWVNLAYQNVVQETGCLQLAGTTDFTADINSYLIPDEVEWIRALVVGYADGTVSNPCRQITLDEMLEQRRMTEASGQAIVAPLYTLVGLNQIEVWPNPGAGSTLQFWYVYLPDELADDDPPLIHEPFGSKLLEYGALVEGARFKKDPLLPDYEVGFAQWMARFQVWLNRREAGSPAQFRVRPGSNGVRVADRSTDLG